MLDNIGSNDLVVIAEMPSDEAIASIVLAGSALGTTADVETTKILTREQAVKAGLVHKQWLIPTALHWTSSHVSRLRNAMN